MPIFQNFPMLKPGKIIEIYYNLYLQKKNFFLGQFIQSGPTVSPPTENTSENLILKGRFSGFIT